MTFACNRLPISALQTSFVVAAAAALALTLAPARTQACGGTFCDAPTPGGPQVMPVDQTGENILFWIDQSEGGPHTEAHIQIQYEGDPDRFAWVVPVMTVPEVFVGSQAMFDNLLAATVPTVTVTTRFDGNCGAAAVSDGVGCGFAFDDDLAAGGDGFSTGDDEGGWNDEGVEILDRGFAGAFEYVVLTGDSVTELVNWLGTNGYAQDPAAPPILQEYLEENFVFLAFKLRGRAGINEIHPIAIRYPGVEPCIPIRLTRIAAIDDMAIRAFFLGHNRVVPQNWPHVVLNRVKLDWLTLTSAGYQELVSLAIDEAGGRAFITEYAGTDAIVATSGIHSSKWSSEAFVDIDPLEVVDELEAQDLLQCQVQGEDARCSFDHPQVRPLLDRYLPVPEGLDAASFWSCLECYAALVDPIAWQTPPGFAAEFEERVAGPGSHAVGMLAEASTLTRLYTLISPHEMLEDPLFHETTSLGPVDNNIVVTRVVSCDDSPDYMDFGDGRLVALDPGPYPEFDGMPYAEVIERVPMMGPPQVETDNTARIDDIVDRHNRDRLVGPSLWNCAITKLRPEALLAMFAMFGIAWLHRAPRGARRRRD
jgi:hypothetical protein